MSKQQQQYLKTLTITIPSNEIVDNLSSIQDLEFWSNNNNNSNIYENYFSSYNKPLQFIGIVNLLNTPLWSIISGSFRIYTNNEETLNFLQKIMCTSKDNKDDFRLEKSILVKFDKNLYMLIYFEKLTNEGGKNVGVFACLLNFNLNNVLYYKEQESSSSSTEQQNNDGYFIDYMKKIGVAVTRLTKDKISESFKSIVKSEIGYFMKNFTQIEQDEVFSICYNALSFRFKTLDEVNIENEVELRLWIRELLNSLGIIQKK